MLSFNFFDSNEWEVVSNEVMKDKIKALEKEIFMNDSVIDAMQNEIATLEADNDSLRSNNENMRSVIKNNSDYISELEAKVKHLESRNKELIRLCDEEYDKNKGLESANAKFLDQIGKANISVLENKMKIKDMTIEAMEYNTDIAINAIKDRNAKIDNQRKEITHLLKAQEKLKAEIVNKEQIISSLEAKCNILSTKVRELNEGIHNSDDLRWKDKYEALKISSDQAIAALQKKCVNIQYGVASRKNDYSISYLENSVKNLEYENENLNKSAETLKKIIDLIHGKE